jgi:hypothetical protein
MVGAKPGLDEAVPQKTLECDHCGKRLLDGYDLTIYSDRVGKKSDLKHFCSINCLARWVGERGWLYELQLRGIHTPEQVVEHPVQYAAKD